jgi:hypothetical protein
VPDLYFLKKLNKNIKYNTSDLFLMLGCHVMSVSLLTGLCCTGGILISSQGWVLYKRVVYRNEALICIVKHHFYLERILMRSG